MEKRYVGSTDEPLCEAGIQEIRERRNVILRSFSMSGDDSKRSDIGVKREDPVLPKTVYVSPMLRCRQTAEILFPEASQLTISDLREMDFGQFEYNNYEELAGDARYQAYIDSGGVTDFPDAEPQKQFRSRVQQAFQKCLEECQDIVLGHELDQSSEPLVFVVHGGTIMAILETYAKPHKDYFDWQVSACNGFHCALVREKGDYFLKDMMKLIE